MILNEQINHILTESLEVASQEIGSRAEKLGRRVNRIQDTVEVSNLRIGCHFGMRYHSILPRFSPPPTETFKDALPFLRWMPVLNRPWRKNLRLTTRQVESSVRL